MHGRSQRGRGQSLAGQRQELRGIAAGPGEADRQARCGGAVMLETQGVALHGAIERAQVTLEPGEEPLQRKQQCRGVGDGAGEFAAAGETRRRAHAALRFTRGAAQPFQVKAGAGTKALRDRRCGER